MVQGEFRLLLKANPPRPKKHSADIVIEYKCPWDKVPIRFWGDVLEFRIFFLLVEYLDFSFFDLQKFSCPARL